MIDRSSVKKRECSALTSISSLRRQWRSQLSPRSHFPDLLLTGKAWPRRLVEYMDLCFEALWKGSHGGRCWPPSRSEMGHTDSAAGPARHSARALPGNHGSPRQERPARSSRNRRRAGSPGRGDPNRLPCPPAPLTAPGAASQLRSAPRAGRQHRMAARGRPLPSPARLPR